MEATINDIFSMAYKYAEQDEVKPFPPPVQWMEENFIDPVSNKLVKFEPHQKRIIRKALQVNPDGTSKYDLVIWSEPKKSGKTTVAAAVGCYVAENIEAPNEISCVANDKEQSAGRIFGNMIPTLKKLRWETPASKKGEKRDPASYGPNGSVVKAITTNYEKEAGANQGLSLWSELWAYKGERLTRLWEEMTPPPTRKFRMRWVESYAGFIGENLLFQSIYLRVFQEFYKAQNFYETDKVKLQPNVKQIWEDLPVYEVGNTTLVYWSHEPRMQWQTKTYYISQAQDLRKSSFRRLHKNEWVSSDDRFISDEMWKASLITKYKIKIPATYALDAAKNNDSVALVGCTIADKEFVNTTDVYIWEQDGVKDVDFEKVMQTIIALFNRNILKPPLYYDPFQCVKLAQDLRRKGVPCVEFKQGTLRIKSDTFLYKLYKEGRIRNYQHELLRKHIMAASAKHYSDQRVRIIKPEYREVEGEDVEEDQDSEFDVYRKVDGVVAQAMAAYACYHRIGGGWAKSGL